MKKRTYTLAVVVACLLIGLTATQAREFTDADIAGFQGIVQEVGVLLDSDIRNHDLILIHRGHVVHLPGGEITGRDCCPSGGVYTSVYRRWGDRADVG